MTLAYVESGSGGAVFLIVLYAALAVASLVAIATIIRKAGYHPAWVLVTLVPFLNFAMLLKFAFSDWPALRRR
jgi:hypothetical protein